MMKRKSSIETVDAEIVKKGKKKREVKDGESEGKREDYFSSVQDKVNVEVEDISQVTEVWKSGDWKCSKCHFHNHSYRAKCKQCKKTFKSKVGEGNWLCNCGYINLKGRLRCKKCTIRRPAECGGADHYIAMSKLPTTASEADIIQFFEPFEPGEVTVLTSENKSLGKANVLFATYDDAKQAMMKDGNELLGKSVKLFLDSINENPDDTTEESLPTPVGQREGDWECSKCKYTNFGTRNTCKICGRVNKLTVSDWTCPNPECKISNFGARFSCRRCKVTKDGKPSDEKWKCGWCEFNNLPSCVKCNKCSHNKYDDAGNEVLREVKLVTIERNEGETLGVTIEPSQNSQEPITVTKLTSGVCSGSLEVGDWLLSVNGTCVRTKLLCDVIQLIQESPTQLQLEISRNITKPSSVPVAEARVATGDVEWKCSHCGFSNFASRVNCKSCATPKPGTESWECSQCHTSNFASRLRCRSCYNINQETGSNEWKCVDCGDFNYNTRSKCRGCYKMRPQDIIPDAKLAHRVGVSHLGYRTTEEQIKEFFDPLKVVQVDILYKDGHPLGKANAYFRSHEDALKAMEMDGTSLRRYNLNLYLDSAGPENSGDSHGNETSTNTNKLEALGMDAPLVKKYKWDGMLVDLLSQTVEYSLPVDTLLQRCIYSIRGGGGSDRHLVKGQLQEKFDYHLKNHSNIRVVDGVAEIINKPAHTVNSQVETTEKAVSSDTAENNPPTEPVYNKFNWKKSMRLVVEGSGGEISLKKLSKKLMLAYVDFNDSLSKEKLKSLCMKKIKSSTVLVIDKDVVKLK